MIKDLKELERFLKLCRKQGITEIAFEGVSVKFGELPAKSNQAEESEEIETPDALTSEQLMFYAVNPGAQQ